MKTKGKKSNEGFEYQYFIKDHLGNTRVMLSQTGKVLQQNAYYPFGMLISMPQPDLVNQNKYLYNGKELQTDFGLDWYDYGARFYDAQLGRWHVPDPMAEKYRKTSPYVYCIDNPLSFVDSDGRKIKFAPGSSNQFKKDFATAVKALNAHKAGGILASLEKSPKTYYISEATGNISNFDPNTKTINWASREMLLTNNGHSLSPTTILNHEADHANQYDKHPQKQKDDQNVDDDKYGDKEEKRVITGSEQKTAKRMGEIKDGEVTRTDHGGTLYPTNSPTSTEIANIVTISAKKEKK